MSRKRYSDEECLRILRQVEVELAAGADVAVQPGSAMRRFTPGARSSAAWGARS